MSLIQIPRPVVLIRLLFCALFFACLLANPACSQETVEPDSAGTDPLQEEQQVRPTLDLGEFKIVDLRPTRNETAKVTFSMHLAFSQKLTEKQLDRLERWKHRLRDQVIIAVRISEMKEFVEPNLSRLRRKILIRVNRLLKTKLTEEVFVTEYLFRTN